MGMEPNIILMGEVKSIVRIYSVVAFLSLCVLVTDDSIFSHTIYFSVPIIKLPDGLTCSQCILQVNKGDKSLKTKQNNLIHPCFYSIFLFKWTYTAGNTWDCDPITGECCTGCNPLRQEHFRACSDIAISNNGESVIKLNP
jgi:hypothetical protein